MTRRDQEIAARAHAFADREIVGQCVAIVTPAEARRLVAAAYAAGMRTAIEERENEEDLSGLLEASIIHAKQAKGQ